MNRSSGIYLMIGLALLAGGLFLVAPAARAGGWAAITLDELPSHVVAEQPVAVGFMVRQHGHQPMEGLTPQITAVHAGTNESFQVQAEPEGRTGHYVASLTFPQPGDWRWSIEAFTMNQPMPALTVLAVPAPVTYDPAGDAWLVWLGFASAEPAQTEPVAVPTPTQAELGRDLFVAKGCVTCHRHSAIPRPDMFIDSGKNLTDLSLTPLYLRLWLKDPASIKLNTKMPNLELREAEIEALIAFLAGPERVETQPQEQLPTALAGGGDSTAGREVSPLQPAKPESRPAELFFVREQGARGPLMAYDMANQRPHFTLPPGMPSADWQHYYAAIPRRTNTLLQLFNPQTSQLERPFSLAGRWALSGVSPTGRWLALTRIPTDQDKQAWLKAERWETEVQIFDTAAGQAVQTLQLDGNFEVETISAAGDALFLIEHVPAIQPTQYLIRLYDLAAEKLQPGALRAKGDDEIMTGLAWGGVASPDGRWLLTLYLNTTRNVAFIHALDLENKVPFCIDLPSTGGDFNQLKYYTLTLSPDGQKVYAANAALGVVAEASLRSLQVTRQVEFAPPALSEVSGAELQAPPSYSVISKDGQMLYFSNGQQVWAYDPKIGAVQELYTSQAPLTALGLSQDEQRLYLATTGQLPAVFDLTDGKLLSMK